MFFGDYGKAAGHIKRGDTDALREMLENGLDPAMKRRGKSLVQVAYKCGNRDAEELLFDYMTVFGLPEEHRRAWFHVQAGRNEELTRQLNGGLPPDTKDNYGRTLLVNALLEGQASTALLLLEHDVDVTARDQDDLNPPILVAAAVPHAEIVTRILEGGADVNTVAGVRGAFDALTIAAENDNADVVEVLLEHGVDLARFGPRALVAAAGHAAPRALRILLDRGVEVNSVNRDETPLAAAARLRERDLTSRLRSVRGDWTTSDDVLLADGAKVLLQVVRLLLEHGADPAWTDRSGRSALDYARKEGLAAVASVIEARGGFDQPRHLARVRDSGLPSEVLEYPRRPGGAADRRRRPPRQERPIRRRRPHPFLPCGTRCRAAEGGAERLLRRTRARSRRGGQRLQRDRHPLLVPGAAGVRLLRPGAPGGARVRGSELENAARESQGVLRRPVAPETGGERPAAARGVCAR